MKRVVISILLFGFFPIPDCPSCAHTQSVAHVDRGRGALENAKGRNHRRRHAVLRLVDLEVAQRPLRLGAPVLVGRHFNLAKGIALDSLVGHGDSCGVDGSDAGGDYFVVDVGVDALRGEAVRERGA